MGQPLGNSAQPIMEKESNSGARQAITRQKKWFGSLIGTAAVLLCFLLAGWFLVLPGFVEKRLAEELTKLGFDRVEMQVVRIGLNEAKISDLRLGGKDPIVIGKITARYRLGDAMGGQLGTVDIEGLESQASIQKTRDHYCFSESGRQGLVE